MTRTTFRNVVSELSILSGKCFRPETKKIVLPIASTGGKKPENISGIFNERLMKVRPTAPNYIKVDG